MINKNENVKLCAIGSENLYEIDLDTLQLSKLPYKSIETPAQGSCMYLPTEQGDILVAKFILGDGEYFIIGNDVFDFSESSLYCELNHRLLKSHFILYKNKIKIKDICYKSIDPQIDIVEDIRDMLLLPYKKRLNEIRKHAQLANVASYDERKLVEQKLFGSKKRCSLLSFFNFKG